jgi:8-oxo-dGTP diphosphatase
MIEKAALLLFRTNGSRRELLFVRAHDKPYLIFPGGKQEPGETIVAALHREMQEELGVSLAGIQRIGSVTGATPDGRPLRIHFYTADVAGEPQPNAEIAELIWMDKAEAERRSADLTPITITKVLPFLDQKGLWQQG